MCLMVAMTGCGGDGKIPVFPTEGTLTMDGEAIGPAALLLIPVDYSKENPKPSVAGNVDSDGNIVFSCYANGDGAPAGEYDVQFTPSLGGRPSRPIPEAYGNPKFSKLKVKILEAKSDTPNMVNIDLDSKIKKPSSAMATGGGGPPINSKYPPIDPSLMPNTGT